MDLFKLARKAKLPPAEKAVLTALCDRMNDKTGLCYPSYQTVSEDTGYERTTVSRTIKKLRNRGFISWKTVRRSGRFGYNLYQIHQVALNRAAEGHMANNDNTELLSVPSPSGITQRKPLGKSKYTILSSNKDKVADEAVPKLSEKQLMYAKKLAEQYYSEYKDQHYSFDLLLEATKTFLASKQTEEDWRKIGTGLPSPKDMGWL